MMEEISSTEQDTLKKPPRLIRSATSSGVHVICEGVCAREREGLLERKEMGRGTVDGKQKGGRDRERQR